MGEITLTASNAVELIKSGHKVFINHFHKTLEVPVREIDPLVAIAFLEHTTLLIDISLTGDSAVLLSDLLSYRIHVTENNLSELMRAAIGSGKDICIHVTNNDEVSTRNTSTGEYITLVNYLSRCYKYGSSIIDHTRGIAYVSPDIVNEILGTYSIDTGSHMTITQVS